MHFKFIKKEKYGERYGVCLGFLPNQSGSKRNLYLCAEEIPEKEGERENKEDRQREKA